MQKILWFNLLLVLVLGFNAASGHKSYEHYNNPAGEEVPIMAWCTFNKDTNITYDNFKNLHDGGFNISLSLVPDVALTEKTLAVAEEAGIKVMVNCPQIRSLSSIPEAVNKIKDLPAVAGYYLGDEPNASEFQKFKKLADTIYKYDKKHFSFINLLPMVAPERLHAKNYKTYLQEFINTVKLPLFSYDSYPVIRINGEITVKESYYDNLEIVSEVSKETGVPFWAFCLSASHFDYPTPTSGSLLFEAFSALAYGAQGISYYTYMLLTEQTIKYYDAPVNPDGSLSEIWYLCRDVNRQIQSFSKIFLGSEVVDIWHIGKKLPKGTKRFEPHNTPFSEINSQDAGVLVSHLKNDGKDYYVIVSHDPVNSQELVIKTRQDIKRVISNDNLSPMNSTDFLLPPGGYLIFTS